MKRLIFTITISAMFAGFAEDTQSTTNEVQGTRPKRSEIIRQSQMRRFGGLIARPDAYRGKVVFANATGRFDEELTRAIASCTNNVRIRVERTDCEKPTLATIPALIKKIDAEGVVFVTDDESLPPLLHAPESRWALVNVHGLGEGATEPVLKRRVRCELARGFAYLCGAGNSTYANSLMTSVTSPKVLDRVSDEVPPVEVLARFPSYLKGLGITPLVRIPYRQACQEGWAPQPTNEFQQAVWDQVHEIPKKPIKIEFDSKSEKK